jgi:hypothetical protein
MNIRKRLLFLEQILKINLKLIESNSRDYLSFCQLFLNVVAVREVNILDSVFKLKVRDMAGVF